MKKTIITSAIIATLLTVVLIAIYDLKTALTILLMPVLIGMVTLTIGTIWNGAVEIKADIKRRKRAKKAK